jgi:hypothetical protein
MTMSFAGKPLRAPVFIAVLAALIAVFAFAGSAGATSVKLRIETPSSTLFNGTVDTGPMTVDAASGNCGSKAAPASIGNPTALTAVYSWAASLGASAPALSAGYGGTYLCGIGSFVEAYPNGSWLLKLNNLDSPPPNGYVTFGDTLKAGDSVLAYYGDNSVTSSLDISLPANANPGVPVTGIVSQYANFAGDAKSGASGAAVSGGGASATAGSDGSFSITFPSAGTYLVTATKSGAVRGSRWITVDPSAPVIPVKTDKQKRAEARRNCLRTYKWHRTSSPRYKKCAKKADRIGRS